MKHSGRAAKNSDTYVCGSDIYTRHETVEYLNGVYQCGRYWWLKNNSLVGDSADIVKLENEHQATLKAA